MKTILAVSCSLVLLACGSTPPPPDAPASTAAAATDGPHMGQAAPGAGTSEACDHLATLCHEHAGHSALTDECHTIGHGGDAAACEARHDECMAACQEAAKGGAHPHPAGHDGPDGHH